MRAFASGEKLIKKGVVRESITKTYGRREESFPRFAYHTAGSRYFVDIHLNDYKQHRYDDNAAEP